MGIISDYRPIKPKSPPFVIAFLTSLYSICLLLIVVSNAVACDTVHGTKLYQQCSNSSARLIIIIIETFVTRLLQLKNEHKRYICYIKIYKNR